MNVILLERVAKLGNMGEVVTVKEGYARNYLLPQKKALWASKANVDAFEQQKAQLEARNEETKRDASALAERLDGQQFVVIRAASDGGALYGSVSTRDVAEAAQADGFEIDRRSVALKAPIKELGIHGATVTLHPEVEVSIELNVARSPEEAELQRQGKSVQELAAEEEAAAEFEVQNLFDDLGAAQLDEDESEVEQRTAQPAVREKSEIDED
ncbi:50S ribosomal protein L9 [Palleronia sediminis]|uniref:Large ribosomal subunit protein bL9 n=1 Tax=Palleronia sediminis TaxID=2547833 RepID=A0A4R6AP40_9RHOB|nr:50S ribosomal protein L9 [Palleronia sediminis]TDL83746.1 50S ribosomal protein L9 [Palleronia sediminis]